MKKRSKKQIILSVFLGISFFTLWIGFYHLYPFLFSAQARVPEEYIPGPVLKKVSEIQSSGIKNPVIGILGQGKGEEIIAQLLATFLKVAFNVAGLLLLVMLLWGGIAWITAGSDKEKLAKAQGRFTSALIGFVIFMSIFAIVNFIAPVLGLSFLEFLRIEWPAP